MKPKYYYLHTNGQLIGTSTIVVDAIGASDYFDSPFVIKYWLVRDKNGEEAMRAEIARMKDKGIL